MSMLVMEIRRVRMLVLLARVPMSVTMFAADRRIVGMVVMAVVVTVGVLVLDCFVHVKVAVAFGDVEVHAGSKERGREDQHR